MSKTFKEVIKEDYGDKALNVYEVALFHNSYNSVISLFRTLNEGIVSVPISYLGIKYNKDFQQYCDDNKIDIINSNKDYYLRFDENERQDNKDFLIEKMKKLEKELSYIYKTKIPNIQKEIDDYKTRLGDL